MTMTVSAVACVAVKSNEIAVVYDSEHCTFSNPSEFHLKPHHDLVAVDKESFTFLKSLNLTVRTRLGKNYLRYPCWECGKDRCLLTVAFLGWLMHMRRKGVTFKHGNDAPIEFKSPRTQKLFIALEFDRENVPIRGCVVADNGYLDGNPRDWLSTALNSNIVIAGIGSKTCEWIRNRVSFPIIEERDRSFSYACGECGNLNCPLVKAYYTWRTDI